MAVEYARKRLETATVHMRNYLLRGRKEAGDTVTGEEDYTGHISDIQFRMFLENFAFTGIIFTLRGNHINGAQ